MTQRLFIVDQNKLRLDRFLAEQIPEISRSKIQKDIEAGHVLVNANKILEGKIAKYYEEACLMEQPFAKNPDIKVKDLVSAAVAKMGENVVVKRFSRFVLGN